MFYRLVVKNGKDFNYEEFFAASKPPTHRQLIKYYSNPDRVYGDMADMVIRVHQLLKSKSCDFPVLRKNIVSGCTYDESGKKYIIVLQRLDMVPLSEIIDGG